MTKEDYMKLPKERLAELLEEIYSKRQYIFSPYMVFSSQCHLPDGTCMNPFHDCINCPRQWGSGGTTTTTNTNINK